MNQKSIRLLHTKIGFVLKWNWGIFLLAKLVFLLLFIVISFWHLQEASAVWQTLFLNRLRQLEQMLEAGTPTPSLPVVHELIIGADGMIRKAPTATLQGMILNASGFFGKIYQLQSGQIALVFFPDMIDGIQRVHFVKRYADEFAVYSLTPKEFFPFSLVGNTHLFVAEDGILWFSDDPQQIGNVYRYAPITIKAGRIYLSFADRIADMSEANLIITQDVTREIKMLLLTTGMLLLVFGSVSLRTRKIQKDFRILQREQADLMHLIQKLSAVVLQSGANVSERLEQLAPALHQSLQDAGQTPLQFEENHQYQRLVQEFIGDILTLVDVVKQEEDKLRDSEEKYRRIFETMEDGYIHTDLATGEILSVNPAAARMLGYDAPEQLQGKNIVAEIYTDGKDREVMIAALKQHRSLHGYVLRFRRRDGAEILADANMHLLFDRENQAVEIEGAIRDITERKLAEAELAQYRAHLEEMVVQRTAALTRANQQLEAEIVERKQAEEALCDSEDRYQQMVNLSPDAILVHVNDQIVFVNPAAITLFGVADAQDLLGHSTLGLLHPDDRDVIMTRRRLAEAGQITSNQMELKVRRGDGTYIDVAMVSFVLTYHGQFAIQATFRDISERKRLDAELIAAKEAAEAANRAKSAFLAHMSHELRTPLNGILGYAQILRRHPDLSASMQDGLNVIYQSGNHLLTLINDVLDLTKIEAGKLELAPADMDVTIFFNRLIEIIRMRAQEKRVRFDAHLDPQLPAIIQADEKRLRQVLLNLLDNAVKFTDSGGAVTLKILDLGFEILDFENTQSASSNQKSKIKNLKFEISDTGIGMTAEQVQRLFTPFELVGDVLRRAEGTGLGLAISRQIVELMGGTIEVASTPGQGSIFWFEAAFPAARLTIAELPAQQDAVVGCAADADAEIVPPPQADLEAVYELAVLGKVFDIETYAEQLEANDARYQPFARKIWALAQAFEDKQIAAMVKHYLEDMV